jgi:hypothetical protein
MNSYYVEAHNSTGSLAKDIEAEDFDQLAQFIRESFAYMNGCRDTSEVDCSWIKFEYDYVEDEDGNDVTAEAQKYV